MFSFALELEMTRSWGDKEVTLKSSNQSSPNSHHCEKQVRHFQYTHDTLYTNS